MTFDARAHVDYMEKVMKLTIQPEWREGVIANVAVAAQMAEMLAEFPLDDHVEPAAVFEAGR